MDVQSAVVLIAVLINVVLTVFLIMKIGAVRRSVQNLKVIYFTEVTDISGFVKKQKKVQVKAQLLVGDIPIGHPFLVSEQITEQVDEAKIKHIVDEIAKPLARLGISVATNGLLPK